MAQYILENTVTISTSSGMVTLKAGHLIDDAVIDYPISRITDVGGSLVATSNMSAVALAAILAKYNIKGVDPSPLANPQFATGGSTFPTPTLANSVLQLPLAGPAVASPLRAAQILANLSVSLTATGGNLYQMGHSVVHPAFTASSTYTPVSAILTDNAGSSPLDVSGTPTSFSSTGTFVKNGSNQSVTFTLTDNDGVQSAAGTTTLTWTSKCAVVATTDPGVYGAAWITSQLGGLSTTNTGSFTITAGAGQYGVIIRPTSYGTPVFTIGGFSTTYPQVASAVAVTNSDGITENYDAYLSSASNFGSATLVITS